MTAVAVLAIAGCGSADDGSGGDGYPAGFTYCHRAIAPCVSWEIGQRPSTSKAAWLSCEPPTQTAAANGAVRLDCTRGDVRATLEFRRLPTTETAPYPRPIAYTLSFEDAAGRMTGQSTGDVAESDGLFGGELSYFDVPEGPNDSATISFFVSSDSVPAAPPTPDAARDTGDAGPPPDAE